MMKKQFFLRSLSIFLFVGLALSSWAQRTVKGLVKEASGEPLMGVTVHVKGTQIRTVTDLNGNYTIKIPEGNQTLAFSFIGFSTLDEKVGNRSQINVTLSESVVMLDEFVAIGYGTANRKELTGSIASMGEKTLKDLPVNSALDAMSGRMAGVNVTRTEGSPDAEINIRVRGGGSITQDNNPLYIVDGFPVPSIANIPTAEIASIDVLKDAASTAIYGAQGANGVVLITTKSAKEGKVTVNFNAYWGFNKVYNLNDVLSPHEFVLYQRELDPLGDASLNPSNVKFFDLYGRWTDIDIWKARKGEDWQRQLYDNTGFRQSYSASITGGNKMIQSSLTLSHDDEDYIMVNSKYLRDAISLKLNYNVSNTVKVDFSGRMTNTVVDGASLSGGKLRDGVKYAPILSLTSPSIEDILGNDEDISSPESLSSLRNPIYNIKNEYRQQRKFENTYNAGLSWEIIKNLKFRTQATYAFIFNTTDNIWVKGTGESSANGGMPVAKRIEEKGTRWGWQNTLNYVLKAKQFKADLLIGQEMNHRDMTTTTDQSKFYPSDFTAQDVLAMWNYGTPLPTYTRIGEPERTFSYFGRANLSYTDRYLLNLTARVDGKNVFSAGNRWGFFPGVSGAWRIREEEFMSGAHDWLSNLKLRAGYGAVGNARVPASWRQDYEIETEAKKQYYYGENPQTALRPSKILFNRNLTWETKLSSNVALDFGFFNERLSGTVEYYYEITKDLIMRVPIPNHSGFVEQYQNVGQTSNRGVEITLNGVILDTKDWRLGASFNIAFNQNRIDKYVGADQGSNFAQSGWGLSVMKDDYLIEEGKPIGQMYGFVTDGTYTFDDFTFAPSATGTGGTWKQNELDANGNKIPVYDFLTPSYMGPGTLKLKDLDGDGKITSLDRKVIGNAQPLFTGGLGLNAGFRGFDLSAFFNFSYGNQIYNANKIDFSTFALSKKYQNVLNIMNSQNRWSIIDPISGNNVAYGAYADEARFRELNANSSIWSPMINQTFFHSWAVEDGSFLRLSNLTLGYTIPQKLTQKIRINTLRVYATANNLFCLTKYTGQDPEVDTRRSTPLTPNVDYSAYPKAHSYVFGLNVTF